MRILVLGGTYFLGRSFVKAAEARGDEVFFINRGNRREILSESELRNTYFLDRHDIKALSEVDPGHIDVLVDFCAYNEGDIRLILENAGFSIGQYIFVSTTDVYRRGTGKLPVTEDAELESRDFGGEAGGYILGKVALEKEVRKLLAQGAQIDALRSENPVLKMVDFENIYPIEKACKTSFEMASLLLDEGARADVIDPYIQATPLIFALSEFDDGAFGLETFVFTFNENRNAVPMFHKVADFNIVEAA